MIVRNKENHTLTCHQLMQQPLMKLRKFKILSYVCLHFARQDGQDGKKQKENHATKKTKISKTKRLKYGMNEIYVTVNVF